MPEQELDDSLEILEQAGLVSVSRHIGGGLPHFQITTYGFQQYAQAYIDGYETTVKGVALAVVNQHCANNESLADHLKLNQFLVDHSLAVLESQSYVRLSRCIGGHISIINVSATLRRALA
ncbi:MAG: hypothetical protein V4443_10500 [Pseudomonadota bacterium]